MFLKLALFCLLVTLYGCMLGYNWVNTDYPADEMSNHFAMDKGECIQKSDMTYRDPAPVQNPDELYDECMADTTREESYPVKTEDGNIEYRTVTRRGNPFYCRTSRAHRDAYREYQSELRQQQLNRAKFVNSCMAFMGWERIKLE